MRVSLIFAIILGVVLLSTNVSAQNITVCSSGCNSTTIQGGIDLALNGDAVFVSSGVYTENIVVDKIISLEGQGSAVTAILGDLSRTVDITSSYVNISGFRIENGSSGIYLNGVENCNIFDNLIIDNGIGIDVYFASNNTIYDNNITLIVVGYSF